MPFFCVRFLQVSDVVTTYDISEAKLRSLLADRDNDLDAVVESLEEKTIQTLLSATYQQTEDEMDHAQQGQSQSREVARQYLIWSDWY